MQKMLERGFTLIELLVVIAIIGILAAVVLTSLSGAQTGALNSNIQQAMGGFPATAQLYYNQNGFSYDGVCADELDDQLGDIAAGAGALAANDQDCNDGIGYWVATFELAEPISGNTHWCVDSEANRQAVQAALDTEEDCDAIGVATP